MGLNHPSLSEVNLASQVEAYRLKHETATTAVVLAGKARSFPLMLAIANSPGSVGSVVGCDDTELVGERKKILEGMQSLSQVGPLAAEPAAAAEDPQAEVLAALGFARASHPAASLTCQA